MSDTSRFDVPNLADLPDDIREAIEQVSAKAGFIPNVFLTFARRPKEFRAFFAFHEALMESDEGLSLAEREMIVVATSALNSCLYCVVAHGAILRIRAKDQLLPDQLAVNYLKADLSERQQQMLDFAMMVADDSASITDEDIDDMRINGFTDDEIWDIGAITSLFALSNRYANFAGMLPNSEFYSMAR